MWDGRSAARHFARISFTGPSGNVASGGSSSAIAFGTTEVETISTFGDHSLDRLVIPATGPYMIELYLIWNEAGATGIRDIFLDIDGVQVKRHRTNGTGTSSTDNSILVPWYCNAGDVIDGRKFHTAGANLTVASARLAAYSMWG